ncbi:sensor histidine kinase [Nocardia fluminea]|uniref:sensor histidine kinase n=1 Tax=Nocardia fluminea TaxID=134984 RepID=UPI00378E814C
MDDGLVRWWRAHPVAADAVTAFALLGVCVLMGLLVHGGVVYFGLTVALLVPLIWRRRWPSATAVAVAAAAGVQWLTVRDTTGALPADLAVPVVVYTVAAHGSRNAGRLTLLAGLGGAMLGGWSWPQLPMPAVAHLLVGSALAGTVAAAWLGGAWQRSRHSEFAALAAHAALLEREGEQRTRLAVLEERTRIARDLHDILAHSLAVIIAQSDGGRYAARAEPDRAIDALRAIGDHGRAALADTRRAIGVLREDTHGEPNPAPTPGIAELTDLTDDLRVAGLSVNLSTDLPADPLDTGLGLLVYRIVQEGLTNVVKHAGPTARAEVSVRTDARWLRVEVTDDGRAGLLSGSPGGFGLIGMRERVESYGGTVTLAHRDDGGHLLAAVIPLRGDR